MNMNMNSLTNERFIRKIGFILTTNDHRYYHSDHPEWISQNFSIVEDECDATVIEDLFDVYYLLDVINTEEWDINILLLDDIPYYLGTFPLDLFFEIMKE